MKEILQSWKCAISEKIKELYNIEILNEEIIIDFPQKVEFGDFSTNVAFIVSKRVNKNPQQVAEEISKVTLEKVSKIEAKGAYLNIFLNREEYLTLIPSLFTSKNQIEGKVIVEHTNINPNKAAHIGHLRNAVLGDTLVRCLKFCGYEVEIQNYIDDTGVQVADVVAAFHIMEGLNLEEIKKVSESKKPFDKNCCEIYTKVQKWYEENPSNLEWRYKILKAMEEGNNEIAEIGSFISQKMVYHHLKTMDRLGIRYDFLPFESDVLKSGFFEEAFEIMKEKKLVEYVDGLSEEKLCGCWVMRLKECKEFEGLKDADKVIIRSNGTVTYLGKDFAYQMWKLGLLKKDFSYTLLKDSPYPIYRSSVDKGSEKNRIFGKGKRVYNVIDVRQTYLQKIIKEGLKLLNYEKEAENSIHFAYEMVALSTRFVKEEMEKGKITGLDSEDLKKPFIEMSGRKGIAYIADDFIDKMVEMAKDEILKRESNIEEEEAQKRAELIAKGAIKYYLLKFHRNQIVAFDMKSALSFEGESGPYLQYTAVRARNILNKAMEKSLNFPNDDPKLLYFLEDEELNILRLLLRIPSIIERSIELLELNLLVKYIFEIAQRFNNFYHKFPVLKEEDEEKRNSRLIFVKIFYQTYSKILTEILGIDIPERM